jgi:HD-like signal output (HDOD) protein
MEHLLNQHNTALKKMDQMVEATKEFPGRQNLLFNLLRMTTNVNTFSSELVECLSQHEYIAQKIIDKARMRARLKSQSLTASQLQQSIQKLGFELVHNEVEVNLAKQYAKACRLTNNFELIRLIKSSIRLAFVAKELSKIVHYGDPAMAFFAGLTNYIGQIVIGFRDERTFNEVINMTRKGVDQKGAELAILGFEHSELGARMVQKWELPISLIDLRRNDSIVAMVKPENKELASLMRLAEYIATALSNKDKGPKAMWDKAKSYLSSLYCEMNFDQWDESIKLLFIKILEAEHTVYASPEEFYSSALE